ncbi:unnamed protein product [Cuscuta europaea]|uniref:Uncharacterized protein n=1 Tax=Cuscuta europaea TaxID=41803 RepID=A0A9P0ZSG1_CUSEU|nr:unnamed protein product [Cuscuta europaea]
MEAATPVEASSGDAGRDGDDVSGARGSIDVASGGSVPDVADAGGDDSGAGDGCGPMAEAASYVKTAVIFISIILFALLINTDLFIKGSFVYLTLFSPTEHNITLHSYY